MITIGMLTDLAILTAGIVAGLILYDILKYVIVGTIRKTKNAIHRKTGWRIFAIRKR